MCVRARSFRIMFLAYMVMCTELIITWVGLPHLDREKQAHMSVS